VSLRIAAAMGCYDGSRFTIPQSCRAAGQVKRDTCLKLLNGIEFYDSEEFQTTNIQIINYCDLEDSILLGCYSVVPRVSNYRNAYNCMGKLK
jgi:hypothetical protein